MLTLLFLVPGRVSMVGWLLVCPSSRRHVLLHHQLLHNVLSMCPMILLSTSASPSSRLPLVLQLAAATVPIANRSPVRSLAGFMSSLLLWGPYAKCLTMRRSRRRRKAAARLGNGSGPDLAPFKPSIDAAMVAHGVYDARCVVCPVLSCFLFPSAFMFFFLLFSVLCFCVFVVFAVPCCCSSAHTHG